MTPKSQTTCRKAQKARNSFLTASVDEARPDKYYLPFVAAPDDISMSQSMTRRNV
jgi:hypothetical protein